MVGLAKIKKPPHSMALNNGRIIFLKMLYDYWFTLLVNECWPDMSFIWFWIWLSSITSVCMYFSAFISFRTKWLSLWGSIRKKTPWKVKPSVHFLLIGDGSFVFKFLSWFTRWLISCWIKCCYLALWFWLFVWPSFLLETLWKYWKNCSILDIWK